VRLWRSLKCKM